MIATNNETFEKKIILDFKSTGFRLLAARAKSQSIYFLLMDNNDSESE